MKRFTHKRLSWIGASMLVAMTMLGLSGMAQAAENTKPELAVTSVSTLSASHRPQGVPSDFVVTPNGYFSASCVQAVHAHEKLHKDGTIEHANGMLSKPSTCSKAHYSLNGTRVEANGTISAAARRNTNPTISGWVIDTDYTSSSPIGRIVASWTVPSAPSNAGSQVIYFFPGLEQLPNVQSILQPVLGWNGYGDSAWTLASWNCCVDGTTFHSDPINVSDGDQVIGDTYSTCAAGSSCSNWAIVSTDVSTGQNSTLNTDPYGSLTWVFGGVLEAYSVDTCDQYPASGTISFTNIAVYTQDGNQVASPPWGKSYPVGSQSPQCNYGITATSSTSTLNY